MPSLVCDALISRQVAGPTPGTPPPWPHHAMLRHVRAPIASFVQLAQLPCCGFQLARVCHFRLSFCHATSFDYLVNKESDTEGTSFRNRHIKRQQYTCFVPVQTKSAPPVNDWNDTGTKSIWYEMGPPPDQALPVMYAALIIQIDRSKRAYM